MVYRYSLVSHSCDKQWTEETHTYTHTTTVRHWRHDVTHGLGLWNWIYMVLECFGSTDKHCSEHTHTVRSASNLMLEPACGSHRCWAETLKWDSPSFVCEHAQILLLLKVSPCVGRQVEVYCILLSWWRHELHQQTHPTPNFGLWQILLANTFGHIKWHPEWSKMCRRKAKEASVSVIWAAKWRNCCFKLFRNVSGAISTRSKRKTRLFL